MTENESKAEETDAELLASVREDVEELRSMLSDRISASVVSPRAKVAFKARLLRECLLHRSFELGDCACTAFEEKKTVPAFVLARSTFETAALVYHLFKRVSLALQQDSLGDFDEAFLMKALFGRKDRKDAPYTSFNVLTCIGHVDDYVADGHKEREGAVRGMFEAMCEFAHPNADGCLHAYSRDDGNFNCTLGPGVGDVPVSVGLRNLRIALSVSGGFHKKLAELDVRFRALCERELRGRQGT